VHKASVAELVTFGAMAGDDKILLDGPGILTAHFAKSVKFIAKNAIIVSTPVSATEAVLACQTAAYACCRTH